MTGSHEHLEDATHARGVDCLESLCRSEISAVRTYARALSSPSLRQVSDTLQSCHASHQQRASALADRILELGGRVPNSIGLWGAIMPLLEGAAAALSAKMAIAVLEESEDRLLTEYRRNLAPLDPRSRSFVNERVLPSQVRTQLALSNLKQAVG